MIRDDDCSRALRLSSWHLRWPIMQLLSDEYGPGKYDDEMKDERCLYRRGANFKVISGS